MRDFRIGHYLICNRHVSQLYTASDRQIRVLQMSYIMQKRLLLSVFCAVIVAAPFTLAVSAEDDLSGFTLKQLNAAISSSGVAGQKLYSILTFDSEERAGANIAVLSGSRSGWQVTVLHRVTSGLKVEWRSGKLPDDFDVSGSNNLEIEDIGDEQVVEFCGCARHLCGYLDGMSGLLLYSPHSKQVFFAHYQYDERKPIGSFGSLKFSKNTSEPGNERYKAALQKAMNKILHQ